MKDVCDIGQRMGSLNVNASSSLQVATETFKKMIPTGAKVNESVVVCIHVLFYKSQCQEQYVSPRERL